MVEAFFGLFPFACITVGRLRLFQMSNLAQRTPGSAALPLTRRFAAGLIDTLLLAFVLSFLRWIMGRITGMPYTYNHWFNVRASLLMYLLWGSFEGIMGWSPGKRVVKARVLRADGTMPGFARGMLRALAVWTCAYLGNVIMALGGSMSWASMSPFALLAVLFARSRRSNGWRAEHDRLTDTRVVCVASVPR